MPESLSMEVQSVTEVKLELEKKGSVRASRECSSAFHF
jgi:hypothetical protein